MTAARNLIVHIVFRFDYGGLENGVVNVINALNGKPYHHAIIALSEATGFKDRLQEGVPVYALNKQPGKDPGAYYRLYCLLRELKPAAVHTRNIGTMDCAFIAFLARVPVRIHGEHGWDIFDPDGTNPKYRLMRRCLHRFVHRIVTVSDDLKRWLVDFVRIPQDKVQHICNGVDSERFRPRAKREPATGQLVVGSVTRFSAIKDPLNLVEAFIALRQDNTFADEAAKLLMIGDGELYEQAAQLIRDARLEDSASLPGSQDNIPELLRSMDIFVLGSLREGISNTILEAMASGLPVIATDTGGNGELVEDGVNGTLVPPGDRRALAAAILGYLKDENRRIRHGNASRERVMSRFSINTMVDNYRSLYERALGMQGS